MTDRSSDVFLGAPAEDVIASKAQQSIRNSEKKWIASDTRNDDSTCLNTSLLLTESPCVGICSTTFGDDICFGCKRTYLEVIQWNSMNDEEKNRINQRLLLLEKKS